MTYKYVRLWCNLSMPIASMVHNLNPNLNPNPNDCTLFTITTKKYTLIEK